MAQTSADTRDSVEQYYQRIAPYYDAELANRGDAPFWREYGSAYRDQAILELGAGSGRVTELLAAHGARVLAMDLSSNMLAQARGRFAADARIWLLQADMCHLALRRGFGLVVAADDPFSHLVRDDDRDAALQVIARHLALGGTFVLDTLWFSHAAEGKATAAGGTRDSHEVPDAPQPLVVEQHWQCSRETHLCTAEYRYRVMGKATTRARFEARYWTTDELAERFERAGLTITDRWGDFDRTPWHPATSEHLLVEAQLRV